jgi:hypothetical protein
MSGRICRTPRASSTPVIPGMVRSVITRSNPAGSAFRAASPSAGLPNVVAVCPRALSMTWARRAMDASSSTNRIRRPAAGVATWSDTGISPAPDGAPTAGRYTSNVVPFPGRLSTTIAPS